MKLKFLLIGLTLVSLASCAPRVESSDVGSRNVPIVTAPVKGSFDNPVIVDLNNPRNVINNTYTYVCINGFVYMNAFKDNDLPMPIFEEGIVNHGRPKDCPR